MLTKRAWHDLHTKNYRHHSRPELTTKKPKRLTKYLKRSILSHELLIITPEAIKFWSKISIFFFQSFSTLSQLIAFSLNSIWKGKKEDFNRFIHYENKLGHLINLMSNALTCLRSLDLRADSLLDCLRLCLFSSLSSCKQNNSLGTESRGQ